MNALPKTIRKRSGITITEALASIAVAAVGLFAVLAVIPFAARQTGAGLDLDSSVAMGKNAFQDFDVRGMGNPRNWRVAYRPGAGNNVAPTAGDIWGKTIVIDPLFLNQNFAGINVNNENSPTFSPEIAVFPFSLYHQEANRNPYTVTRMNLAANGTAYNMATAESVFRSMNELVFDEPGDKLNFPPQSFKRDGTVELKRNYRGDITWMAMVVPERCNPLMVANANSELNPHFYRLYVIVFKNRQLNYRQGTGSGEAVYRANPIGNGQRGGDFEFDLMTKFEDGMVLPVANQLQEGDYLNAGDWVLLTDYNQIPPSGGQAAPTGTQWLFYQIQRVGTPGKVNRDGNNTIVTLSGPDWTGDIDLQTPPREARAIVLSNVITVYEKTIRIEYDSIWNE
ncbi:MAG: hypothetical protein P8M80_00790 [Pirellulaceae bacterium]|nr:hypothetical protein [Pirellulaceae bacterium]